MVSGIKFAVESSVALITLNRPERANALDTPAMLDFVSALEEVRRDPAIAVAIITGTGDRAFCAGMDWKVMNEPDMPNRRYHDVPEGLMLEMKPYMKGIDVWKPIIAAVNGPAIALGAHIVIGADLRVASDRATISFNEPHFGDLADGGAMARLPRQIPFVHAMDLLLTGRNVSAPEMLRMGLVNEVVSHGALMDRAWEMARFIVETCDARAVQVTKRAVITGLNGGLDQAFLLEALYKEMLRNGVGASDEQMKEWAAKYSRQHDE